jgi:hypothetical protein
MELRANDVPSLREMLDIPNLCEEARGGPHVVYVASMDESAAELVEDVKTHSENYAARCRALIKLRWRPGSSKPVNDVYVRVKANGQYSARPRSQHPLYLGLSVERRDWTGEPVQSVNTGYL